MMGGLLATQSIAHGPAAPAMSSSLGNLREMQNLSPTQTSCFSIEHIGLIPGSSDAQSRKVLDQMKNKASERPFKKYQPTTDI